MTQSRIVVITGDAPLPHAGGADRALQREAHRHSAFAEDLHRHSALPVTTRPVPATQDADAIVFTVPETLLAHLALESHQAARTVAFGVPRPDSPRLAQDFALAAVIDDMQYLRWFSHRDQPPRARIYGRRDIATRMHADSVPAAQAPDYVLLSHPAFPGLPALITAYLRELTRL